jgi:hypothetical protein
MKSTVTENSLYLGEFAQDKLFEIKEYNANTAIVTEYPTQKIAVVTKPRIADDTLEWRSMYKFDTLTQAKQFLKEYELMYGNIENIRTVTAIAKDIDKNVGGCMEEMYLYNMQKAYNQTKEYHSEYDICTTVALSINHKNYDGRLSQINKQWAESFLEVNKIKPEDYKRAVKCDVHPTLLNGFTDTVRQNIANRTMTQLKGNGESIQLDEEQTKTRKR